MHSQGNAGAKKAVMIELHTFPTEESQSIPTVTVSPGAAFPVQARPPEEAMTHRPHGHLLPSQPKQHKGSLPQKGLVRISSCLQDKALLVHNHSPILPPVFSQGPTCIPTCTHAHLLLGSFLSLSETCPFYSVPPGGKQTHKQTQSRIPFTSSPTCTHPPACFLLLRASFFPLSSLLITDPRQT